MGNGGTTGQLGTGALINNGTLAFNRSDALTLGGALSGPGALQQIGPGTLTLTGTNTYTGTTTITGGTLQVGNGATAGQLGTGAVTNDGSLSFNRRDAVTVANAISGSGALHQVGSGTLILAGQNTYSGPTTISGGVLQVGNGGTAGTLGSGAVANDGVLTFNRSDGLSVAGDISGRGAVHQIGSGITVLTGTNTYTGGTTISAGTLQVGAGGARGSLVGDVYNAGVLAVNRADALTVGGVISGTGAFEQIGTGTTILTGANTYSGTTTIGAGTLQVGNGGTTGQLGTGALINNGTLTFNRSDALTAPHSISGTGRVIQAGSGLLSLSGLHSYTGGTLVNAGALTLTGTLASAVSVATNASFGGIGAIAGPLTVDGTLTVGFLEGPYGALNVGGNVILAPGARVVFPIDASGDHSLLVASGTAVVNGGRISFAPRTGSYRRVTFYPVLYAGGGVAGTVTATSTNAALEPWISRSGKTLILTLLNTTAPLAAVGMTSNGVSIGGAFDRLRAKATGDLSIVTRELAALDDSGLSHALDTASGEIHSSVTQLAALDGEAAMDLVRQEIVSRGTFEVGTRAKQTFETGARVWGRFQAQRTAFAGGSVQGGDAQLSGFVVGGDRTLADRWLAGIGGGYTTGSLALDRADSSRYTAARGYGYVGFTTGRWVAHTGASVARSSYAVDRTVVFTALLPEALGGGAVFGGVNRRATSSLSGLATELWGDWAFLGHLGQWVVRPGAGVRYARYGRDGWTEKGADALSLSAPPQTTPSSQVNLGVHIGRTIGRFGSRASATYARELTDGRTTTTVQISDRTDGRFRVNGLSLAPAALMTRLDATLQLKKLELSLGYQARHTRGQMGQAIQFGMTF